MKKLIVYTFIFSFCLIFQTYAQNNDWNGMLLKDEPYVSSPYEYPILTGTEMWVKLPSEEARIAVLQIPEKILKKITTEHLIITCLDYPAIVDLVLGSNYQTSFEKVKNDFNGLQELLIREDLAPKLMEIYTQFTIVDVEENYLKPLLVELILSQSDVIEKLSIPDRKKLTHFTLDFFLRKYEAARRYTTLFPCAEIMKNILIENDIRNLKKFPGSILRFKDIDSVLEGAKKYIEGSHRLPKIFGKNSDHIDNRKEYPIYTQKGTLIPNSQRLPIYWEWPMKDRESMTQVALDRYPDQILEVVFLASGISNCHGQAFDCNISEPCGAMVNTPSAYWKDGSYKEITGIKEPQVGLVINYVNGDHSSYTFDNEHVISKWGNDGPTVRHKFKDAPFDSSEVRFYKCIFGSLNEVNN